MAELKGPIQFIGSMGNIRVYYNKTLKRYIVSTKGGSIKELIMKSPDYARQRENMSEFKACAYWSSLLRQLLESIDHLATGYYFSGFMKLAKAIQKHDIEHEKGFRSVDGLVKHSETVYTEWTQQSTEPEDIVLTASFAEPALSLPGTTVIVALGLEISPGFGELASTSIAGMGTMKIVDCFV